jgi:hypothetical protein
MDLVPVTTANDAGLAAILKGVLEQAGIDVLISGSGMDDDPLPVPAASPYRLLVPAADAQRALDVLAQYETTPDEADDDE